VPLADEVFTKALGNRPNQKDRLREDVKPDADALQRFAVEGGHVSHAGVRTNVDVALRYIEAWLRGIGAVAIHNLMEDAATAEISRSQLWQWRANAVRLEDGTTFSADAYRAVRKEVMAELSQDASLTRLADAVELLDQLVLGEFEDFLTLQGMQALRHG
jgi:malate synthase